MPNPLTISDAPDLINKGIKKVFIKGSHMAKLTYQERKKLPQKDFVIKKGGPGGTGKYPIQNIAHARNALARVSAHGTPAEKAKVRGAVRRKYPSIEIYGEALKS